MKKRLDRLNRDKIYRKFKTTLNFNLIKKSKLTKYFKIFLEKYFFRTKKKVFKKINKRRKSRLFIYNRKKKIRGDRIIKKKISNYKKRRKYYEFQKYGINYKQKRFRKRTINRRKSFRIGQKRKKKVRGFNNVFWRKSFFELFKSKYFSLVKNNNLKKRKNKLSLFKKKSRYRLRKYKIYFQATCCFLKVIRKRIINHRKKKRGSTRRWLKKNRSFSIYMPEAKIRKRRRRKAKKSNWWKLRLMNRSVALHYGFISLKKFRYIFNVYEKGMNFKFKSICRLELMLNMVILGLLFVDNIFMSNNFIRVIGVKVNDKVVSYPYRNLLKNDVISFEKANFKKMYNLIKVRLKKGKSFIFNKLKNRSYRKIKEAHNMFIKNRKKRDYVSDRRNTAWYIKAISEFPDKLLKAIAILKRLSDINEKILQSDIDFFYGIKRYTRETFKPWIIDGRMIMKRIKIIKNIPKYIEANFKIMHFIIWSYPTNDQIAKLFKKRHSFHLWNFSTKLKNN